VAPAPEGSLTPGATTPGTRELKTKMNRLTQGKKIENIYIEEKLIIC
jgi:hypothetical protein